MPPRIGYSQTFRPRCRSEQATLILSRILLITRHRLTEENKPLLDLQLYPLATDILMRRYMQFISHNRRPSPMQKISADDADQQKAEVKVRVAMSKHKFLTAGTSTTAWMRRVSFASNGLREVIWCTDLHVTTYST